MIRHIDFKFNRTITRDSEDEGQYESQHLPLDGELCHMFSPIHDRDNSLYENLVTIDHVKYPRPQSFIGEHFKYRT